MERKESYTKPGLLGKLFGALLFLLAVAMLLRIEVFTKRMVGSFDVASGTLKEVVDANKVDPSLQGSMVYIHAPLKSDGPAIDPLFQVGGDFVGVKRNVKYFQWIESQAKEKKKKKGMLGGISDDEEDEEYKTVHNYIKGWVLEPIDSKDFRDPSGHENTTVADVRNLLSFAPKVGVGAYLLSKSILERYMNQTGKAFKMDQDQQLILEKAWKAENDVDVHVSEDMVYIGKDPQNPQIGDMKVTFSICSPAEAYVLAKVQGDSLCPDFIEEASKEYFEIKTEPFDAGSVLNEESKGYDTFAIFCRVMAWLLIVWAVHLLRGTVVYPLRNTPGVSALVPKQDNKLTLWIVGTVIAVIVIAVCYLIAKML